MTEPSTNGGGSAMRSDAELCRKNGWTIGTRLVGDEGYGPTVIRLTYVSDQNVMAIQESHNGKPSEGRESSWTLMCRDWKALP
jgi:hypothetical protein